MIFFLSEINDLNRRSRSKIVKNGEIWGSDFWAKKCRIGALCTLIAWYRADVRKKSPTQETGETRRNGAENCCERAATV